MKDALNYLPTTRVLRFSKGSTIYDSSSPAEGLFLVLSGRVRVDRIAADGRPVLLRIAAAESFFGACSLIPIRSMFPETARAMSETDLMIWTAADIDALIGEKPKLGMALLDYFARQNAYTRERLLVINRFHTRARVQVALVQLASLHGSSRNDGAQRISNLTHNVIASYVGTSREIVTGEMNRLRRMGYVAYTRLHTDVYSSALVDWMRQDGNPYCARLQKTRGVDALLAMGVS